MAAAVISATTITGKSRAPVLGSILCQSRRSLRVVSVRAVQETKKTIETSSSSTSTSSAEETTEKFGIEAGLWKVLLSLRSCLNEISKISVFPWF